MTDYVTIHRQPLAIDNEKAFKNIVVDSVISGSDLVKSILLYSNNSMLTKMNKMMEDKNNSLLRPEYTNGSIVRRITGDFVRETIKNGLESDLGEPVELVDIYYGRMRSEFHAKKYMYANMGLNLDTGEVTTHSFTGVVGSLWFDYSFFRTYPVGFRQDTRYIIHLFFKDDADNSFHRSLTTNSEFLYANTGYDVSSEFFEAAHYEVLYKVVSSGSYGFWQQTAEYISAYHEDWYNPDTQQIEPPIFEAWPPELIPDHKEILTYYMDEETTYFRSGLLEDLNLGIDGYPSLSVRQDHINTYTYDTDYTGSYYNSNFKESVERNLQEIGLNLEEMNGYLENNSNLQYLEDCFVKFSVNPFQTDSEAVSRYCFEFFEKLLSISPDWVKKKSWDAMVDGSYKESFQIVSEYLLYDAFPNSNQHSYYIEGIGEHRGVSRNYMTLTYIDRYEVVGSFGSSGSYRTVIGSQSTQNFYLIDPPYSDYLEWANTTPVYYDYQVESNKYIRVEVAGLYTAYRNGTGGRNVSPLSHAYGNSDQAQIPLLFGICNAKYSPYEFDLLLKDAAQLISFFIQSVSTPWYAAYADVFNGMLIGLAVFLVAVEVYGLITGTSSVGEFLVAGIKLLGEAWLISEAADIIVEELGAEGALKFLVVLSAAALGGSISGSDLLSLNGLLDVQSLLKITSAISTSIQEYSIDETKRIEEDLKRDLATLRDATEELERKRDMLMGSEDYLNITERPIPSLMKPDLFYETKLHSGNIGIKAIESLSSFYDNQLRIK